MTNLNVTPRSLSSPIAMVPLLVGTLLAVLPAVGSAQGPPPPPDGDGCWVCGWSDEKPWPSQKCYEGSRGGTTNCETWGGPVTTCHRSGGDCEDTMADAATDQQAIEMIKRGEMLPPDGGYFFVTEEEMTLVVRKCDLSLVARIPAWAVGRAEGRVARVGGE